MTDPTTSAVNDAWLLQRLWRRTPVLLRVMWVASLLMMFLAGLVPTVREVVDRYDRQHDPIYHTAIQIATEGEPVVMPVVQCAGPMPTAGLGQQLVWADALAVRLASVQVTPDRMNVRILLEVDRRGPWPEEWSPHPITASIWFSSRDSQGNGADWGLAPAGQVIQVPMAGSGMVSTSVSAHQAVRGKEAPKDVIIQVTPGYVAGDVATTMCWSVPIDSLD